MFRKCHISMKQIKPWMKLFIVSVQFYLVWFKVIHNESFIALFPTLSHHHECYETMYKTMSINVIFHVTIS
jgi:ssDNA-specific exonuclease RecJ